MHGQKQWLHVAPPPRELRGRTLAERVMKDGGGGGKRMYQIQIVIF